MTLWHLLLIVLSVFMVAVSVYLTRHYWDLHFNDSLVTNTLCNINNFFQCDTASTSSAAQFFGVPTSVFCLLFGFFLLCGSLFPSERMERTNFAIAAVNALACVGLFFYSLLFLKSLCPMCTLYY